MLSGAIFLGTSTSSARVNTLPLDLSRRVMEGGDLSAVLKRRGQPLAVAEVRVVALRVLTAVDNMHKVAGICHASLKPDNIGLLRAGDFRSTVVFDIATWQPLDWRPSHWGVRTVLWVC